MVHCHIDIETASGQIFQASVQSAPTVSDLDTVLDDSNELVIDADVETVVVTVTSAFTMKSMPVVAAIDADVPTVKVSA